MNRSLYLNGYARPQFIPDSWHGFEEGMILKSSIHKGKFLLMRVGVSWRIKNVVTGKVNGLVRQSDITREKAHKNWTVA
jgi:hypothetical protein